MNDAVHGAKANWATGAYTGNDLTPGKEKWRATCHDKVPAFQRDHVLFLLCDLPIECVGDQYTVTDVWLFGNPSYTSSDWRVYVSTDGLNFTQVGSWSVGGGSQWYEYEYTLPTPSMAVYTRIEDWHGGPEQADAASEFDFRGSL